MPSPVFRLANPPRPGVHLGLLGLPPRPFGVVAEIRPGVRGADLGVLWIPFAGVFLPLRGERNGCGVADADPRPGSEVKVRVESSDGIVVYKALLSAQCARCGSKVPVGRAPLGAPSSLKPSFRSVKGALYTAAREVLERESCESECQYNEKGRKEGSEDKGNRARHRDHPKSSSRLLLKMLVSNRPRPPNKEPKSRSPHLNDLWNTELTGVPEGNGHERSS